MWQAVVDRDRRADGLFVYAVSSTRIYCRPSCASRRPRRDRVEFFPAPSMAETHGFRACRRCRPRQRRSDNPVIDRVHRACRAVAARPDAPWTVAGLARAAGASVSQLQRGFRTSLGVSPRDYVMACRRRHFLDTLRRGHSVTDAVYESGYGSPSRVYDSLRLPGMTPATYGRGGRGVTIDWRTTRSAIGRVLVAATARGLCFVGVGSSDRDLLVELRREFPNADVASRPSPRLAAWAAAARDVADRGRPDANLPVDVHGTAFQWKVWRALTRIPRGETRSYGDVARSIGRPTASRAVARACATNPLALVVPCHRVVASNGSPGGYRWGSKRKAALLEREKAR
jgi:AraC family transcriptional regulator of adaptative response/methylated-DNA-[protein]-cysteine methyltransferase